MLRIRPPREATEHRQPDHDIQDRNDGRERAADP
jgi:hypothetical protein